jgi:undecaprenyl-diphosphatase
MWHLIKGGFMFKQLHYLVLTAFILFGAVSILGFLSINGFFRGFDHSLSAALSLEVGVSPPWLIQIMKIISWIGGGIQRFVIVALLSAALWRYWGWGAGLAMALTSLLSAFTSETLKHYFGRLRPDFVPQLDPITSFAYPSGHATNAAVVYLLFVLLMPNRAHIGWQILAAIMIFLTGLSRIMLAVHWPSDVLGGWMLGSSFALGAYAVIVFREQNK